MLMNSVPNHYYAVINGCRENRIPQALTALSMLLKNDKTSLECKQLFRLCIVLIKLKKTADVQAIFDRLVQELAPAAASSVQWLASFRNYGTVLAETKEKAIRLTTVDPIIAERMYALKGNLQVERFPNGDTVWSIVIEPHQLPSVAAYLRIPQYLEWFNTYAAGQLSIDFN